MNRFLLAYIAATFLFGTISVISADLPPMGKGFLQRKGTELLLDEMPFRAISVNKFDLFLSLLNETQTEDQISRSIADIASKGFRVVRFGAIGFYPKDMQLWGNDLYWKKMDFVISEAKKNNVYLLPAIVWNWYLFTDMANETMQDLLTDKDSKSRQYLDLYIYQIVSRYKDEKTVLFWEIGNELNLPADLEFMHPYGFSDLNPVQYGTSFMRVRRDNFRTKQMIPFMRDLAVFIKKLDPNHLITTGYASPRPAAQHLRLADGKGDWTEDSPAEAETYIRDTTPDPIDIISLHFYSGHDNMRFGVKDKNSAAALKELKKICDKIGKPVILGEMGGEAYEGSGDSVMPFTADLMKQIVDSGYPISLYWMWGGSNPLMFDLDKSPALVKLMRDTEKTLIDVTGAVDE